MELTGFAAAADGTDQVRLSWQTVSEAHNARFEVQRRAAPLADADAARSDWAPVARVQSKAPSGTSAEPLSYTATDATLPFEVQTLTYRLVQVDLDGTRTVAGEHTIEIGAPAAFALHGSSPNPMRTQTTIRYELPEAREVTVAVYDALGRQVRTLVDGVEQTGRQKLPFEARKLASGVYFYRITAGDYTETRQLVLVR